MADSPLNHSWPSFSKLWMKRWSFKRGSEYKPCIQPPVSPCGQFGAKAQNSSPFSSPECVAEDVFFESTFEDQDRCSVVSDYDCLTEEESCSDLNSSLSDCQYFRDLEGEILSLSTSAPIPGHAIPSASSCNSHSSSFVPPLQSRPLPVRNIDNIDITDMAASSGPRVGLSIGLNGLLESMESSGQEKEFEDMDIVDTDLDSFPTLVRSMSTSRRHSWGTPVSPINLGRRLSLDTAAVDSDGEEDRLNSSFLSHKEPAGPEQDVTDGPGVKISREKTAGADRHHRSSELLSTDECFRAAHISRVVQTSKQAAGVAGEPMENLHSREGQSHMLLVQKVLQELKLYHGAKKKISNSNDSGNVTWYEFLSKENEEEEDHGEKVEKGTRVKRKLSSLRSRVTGSFNKDKGKTREKEQQRERVKEVKEVKDQQHRGRVISSNGHDFVPGSFSSCATCSLCSKGLQKKHGLQCMNCAVNVHKSCKSLLTECTSHKRDSSSRSGPSVSSYLVKDREAASSQALDGHTSCPSGPGMTILSRGGHTQPAAAQSTSSSAASAPAMASLRHHSSSGSLPGEMDETDSLRSKRCNEDVISLAPSTVESINVEDVHYAAVRADLESDAQDLEAESWSSAVDPQFVKKHSKGLVKRQDVIYELMQTEMHHVRNLKIMLQVYVHELKESLQMDSSRIDCLFPRLENLLELHTHFLSRLKERQRENLHPPNTRNFIVHRVADILIAQFSGEVGEKMKESYGDFCSHHCEAVAYYKEQLQNNKKFHATLRKINNLSIVRRLGVPECILLVTQRITKYPVLVERILHNTEAGTQEFEELTHALALIKQKIVQVDALVNLYEKTTRLRDIYSKMEPKSQGKIKDGRVFRREDLAQGRRRLLHEGTVNWKAASGRLKDILAVLLSDVLILIQEKDQRYVFATVDNKPSVISLQKLIVREVAHEEKAMFLICASSNEPEMYEIHTSSKEERNTWMTHIRQAVESCPQTEERLFSEEEEARASRLREFQERLSQKDAVIMQALSEKLQLFADVAESVAGVEDTASRSRLLLRGDATDLQQGEALLKGAITEVENLQNLLQSGVKEEPLEEVSGALLRRAGTFGGYDSTALLNNNCNVKTSSESKNRDRSQRASSDPQLKDLCGNVTHEETVDESCCSPLRWNRIWMESFPEAEFFDRVLMLSQRLYSLQAIISHQDSQIELQRASLIDRASLPSRYRGNCLQEQEKQRTLALQREELANFHKLQAQHRQEQQRWERERAKHHQQVEATEAKLQQREEECKRLEEQLAEERQELEQQREKYQEDLERLRESTRAVEKEKERLEHQKKCKRKTIEVMTNVVPVSGSLNGVPIPSGLSELKGLRSSVSVAPADFPERPEVTLRREVSSCTLKTEVPLHLLSTTNQHKSVNVSQQIPTKLAALSSVKASKPKSGKASHRSDSTASMDMKQMLPLKLSAREDSSLKAKRSISPHQPLSVSSSPLPLADPLSPPDSAGPDCTTSLLTSPPAVTHKPPSTQPPLSVHSLGSGSFLFQHQPPPPYQGTSEDTKEDVIFF
ncbi:unnamed protein product [Knipowitschia caucasica]|uniref:Rho guanine nucleotide exchange factor 18-like n=1 Tax=Knipowitschia caucasica TaxID=637954 RepID=A0AAV2L2W6_KNICA